MKLKNIDVEKVARAIEKDAGEALPRLRESLAQAKRGEYARVTTPEQSLVREARTVLGLSQAELAARIATPVATLRDWEQGRFQPPGAVGKLLRLLIAHPDLVDELKVA